MRDYSVVARWLCPMGPDGHFVKGDRVTRDVWFRRAHDDTDIRSVIHINASLFGPSKRFTEDELVVRRRTWLSKNPDVYRVLEVDGQVVGFLAALPLTGDIINSLVAGAIQVSDVQAGDIQEYKPGTPINVFVQTVGLDRRYQGMEKRIFGIYLVSGLANFLGFLGQRGVELQYVYTRSDEADGIRLASGLGFDQIASLPGVAKVVFRLDLSKSSLLSIPYEDGLVKYHDSDVERD